MLPAPRAAERLSEVRDNRRHELAPSGSVSARSCVNRARTRQTPLDSSTKSREVSTRSSNKSRTKALSETNVVEYHDPAERLVRLRAAVRAAGIKTVARETGLSQRHLREFVNKKTTPLRSTMGNIESALQTRISFPRPSGH